jgi:hypothetical protein
MPGAPNRPPEITPDAPPEPPGDAAGRKVLRRLAPMRVALNLDLWKGQLPGDLVTPYDRAEASFQTADFPNAESSLDLLSVRFAEPRWPTLPKPFRELRVSIPQPQPPQWDPEHTLAAPEKEERKLRRFADQQLALAKASVEWCAGHGVPADDLATHLTELTTGFQATGATEEFWGQIDRLWAMVRARVPAPVIGSTRRPPAAAAADAA